MLELWLEGVMQAVKTKIANISRMGTVLQNLTTPIDFSPHFTPSELQHIQKGHRNLKAFPRQIGESAVIVLLEYHLKNDSVFDVSEHMEFYEVRNKKYRTQNTTPTIPQLIYPYQI